MRSTLEHAEREKEAFAFLKKSHPELYELALPYKGRIYARLHPKRTNAALFEALSSSITSQQLSTKAAASIFTRLRTTLGGPVTPTGILATPAASLRTAGLSEAKVRSLKELAAAVESKELDLLGLRKKSAEEAIAALTVQRGIGPWTAEMFLMFALASPDIFSPGDLILARRMRRYLHLPETTDARTLAHIAERWSPHRTFVSLLFWQLHHAELEANVADRAKGLA